MTSDYWQDHVVIGWVPLEADGLPFRTTRSSGRWFERKEPVKVYQTEARAKGISPIGVAREVRIGH